MKRYNYIIALFTIFIGMNSCRDKYTEVFTAYSPVYMSYEDLREAVKKTGPRDMVNTGKIYFKDDFIYINEELKGIHIIDNSNPSNPQNIGFIEIPGNVDIAIKNDILYADSYIDLVAINIANPGNITEVHRVEKVFPYTVPPTDDKYRVAKVDEDKGVVVDWEVKQVRQEMEYHYYPVYFGIKAEMDYRANAPVSGGAMPSGSTFGVGGSMARFGLYNEYLYAVDKNKLYMFDVSTPSIPVDIGTQNVGWDIETMFIYDGHMFLGTQSGMRIYSLKVPTVPEYIGQFWHVTSCDPVVISNGYAYVTLRGGTRCGSNVNRLDIIKLSADYTDNELLASYPMQGPYGLGIDDDILFVCDGDAGLKVYDVKDKLNLQNNQLAVFLGINTYDVIPLNGNLFMIGDDGFYQYDYSDIQNITQLSFIPVVKED